MDDRKRFQRIEEIFLAAADVHGDEREQLISERCGGDAALEADVRSMLQHDIETRRALDRPVLAGVPGAMPESIGGYRILRKIDAGGMGVVYEAEQENPRRIVALKVINPGIASADALRRFEYEAQLLGRLQHPAIAQVFEAGTFDDGSGAQPFFAMELIRGEPLTSYAERNKLGTRARLDLITRICEGVQHAHGRGIIHRDLKPGNILVDESGQPKILDFGVARATDGDVQTATLRTDIGQLIGTVPYMSPEQATGDPDDLDSRSDVYALGVLSYELLAGRLPYDLQKKMIHEAVRVIREEDPTPLSTINRTLRGDVETIIGKALEKDKTRRYQSAADLAADIRRHLDDEPITARPPGTWYQLAKFARRNRTLVGGVAAVFVVLVAAVIVSAVLYLRADRQRIRAEKAEELATERLAIAETQRLKAEQTAAFTQSMLAGIDPATAGDLDKTLMRMILDDAAERINTELAGEPEVEATIRAVVGDSYIAIGEYAAAHPHLARALQTRREALGGDHPETLSALNDMGVLLLREGKHVDAEPLLRDALEARRRVLGDEHAATLTSICNMAQLLVAAGRYDEAEQQHVEALEARRRVLGEEHRDTLESINNLGELLKSRGRFAEAEPYLSESLDGYRRLLGDDHPATMTLVNNMGAVLWEQGRRDEAETYFREALESRRRVLGVAHPETLSSINNMAFVLHAQGKLAESERFFRDALEGRRGSLGDDHPDTLQAIGNLGLVLRSQQKLDDAEQCFRDALAGCERVRGTDHPETMQALNNLAVVLQDQDRLAEAEPFARRALEGFRRLLGEDHPSTLHLTANMGVLLQRQEKFAEAEPLLLQAARGMDAQDVGEERKQQLHQKLVEFYEAWGKPEKADEWR